jgi:hypothetical protein
MKWKEASWSNVWYYPTTMEGMRKAMKASVKTGTKDLSNIKQKCYPFNYMKLYGNKPVLTTFCSVNLILRSFQCLQSKKNLHLRNMNNVYLI